MRALRGLTAAVTFLTVLPLPAAAASNFELGPALPWFPLVGAAVGAIGGGLRLALDPLLGRGPSTALAMTAMVVVTGALHQDALADTCDGLGARGDRARRLAAMRDSTLGAFGVLAIVLWALILFTVLDELSDTRALLTLIAAGATSRSAGLLHGWLARPARPDGLGSLLRVTTIRLAVVTVIAAAVAVLAVGPLRGALTLGVSVVVGGLSAWLARATVGGSTGDTLGGATAVAELAACAALLASWR